MGLERVVSDEVERESGPNRSDGLRIPRGSSVIEGSLRVLVLHSGEPACRA